MSETIHLELTNVCEADDLITFLATRGLAGSVTRANDHCDIEVRYAVDPDLRLRQDFESALASWLEKGERPLIPVHAAAGEYALRPPAD